MPYYQDRGKFDHLSGATRPMVIPGPLHAAWSWDRQGWANLKDKETVDIGSYGQNELDRDRSAAEYWRTATRSRTRRTCRCLRLRVRGR
jgi:hypothetical protein